MEEIVVCSLINEYWEVYIQYTVTPINIGYTISMSGISDLHHECEA